MAAESGGTQEWIGLPDNSGDPSDDDAIAQQIAEFFGDTPAENTSVFFGTQASDCNAIMNAVTAAGIDTTIIASGSCIDDTVLDNPASVNAVFGQQTRISERPDLYPGYPAWELELRNDLLESSDIRTTPVSAFLRVGFNAGVLAWEAMSEMADRGQDIDDPQAVIDYLLALEDQHVVGSTPLSCNDNTEEFPAVCAKNNTFVTWTGSEWDLEGSPLAGEIINVGDIQARVAEGNPRDAG